MLIKRKERNENETTRAHTMFCLSEISRSIKIQSPVYIEHVSKTKQSLKKTLCSLRKLFFPNLILNPFSLLSRAAKIINIENKNKNE